MTQFVKGSRVVICPPHPHTDPQTARAQICYVTAADSGTVNLFLTWTVNNTGVASYEAMGHVPATSDKFFQHTWKPHKVCKSHLYLDPYSLSLWKRESTKSFPSSAGAPNLAGGAYDAALDC